MKAYKFKRKYYSDLTLLYKDLGLIHENSVDPSKVHCSKADIKIIERELRKAYRKEYPGITKKKLDSAVAMYMLNLGPSERISESIKPGYIIVID